MCGIDFGSVSLETSNLQNRLPRTGLRPGGDLWRRAARHRTPRRPPARGAGGVYDVTHDTSHEPTTPGALHSVRLRAPPPTTRSTPDLAQRAQGSVANGQSELHLS